MQLPSIQQHLHPSVRYRGSEAPGIDPASLDEMLFDTLEIFRRRLLSRRFYLLQRRRRALADEQELLAEREPDWEDVAAAKSAATVLESLSETERIALARIQASLDRIERGTYGYCAVCRATIDEERLSAVPETDRCGACAAAH